MEAITILRIEAQPTTLGEWKASKSLPVLAYDRAISTGYDMKFYDRITGELVKHEFYTDAEFNSQYTTEDIVGKVKAEKESEAKAEELKREAARASLMEKMEAVEEPKEEPKPKTKRKSKAKAEDKVEVELKEESDVSGE
ncbi:hypothetical protein PQC39_gp136 [Vibrio phage Vp_R1]|uniref:Uncharacterized protein n=1 Tax=Vibrio phage Vp_R1 TaxID=2059867 RepID=A0A2H5BQ85_9CAUD|nr:hypothetical protein PQC39_gp136 [Vibrio phage Vp_R1]AUG88500.1 hypothetical protein VPR_136 [Vibrio phage Vp_R1]